MQREISLAYELLSIDEDLRTSPHDDPLVGTAAGRVYSKVAYTQRWQAIDHDVERPGDGGSLDLRMRARGAAVHTDQRFALVTQPANTSHEV